jgi:ABC-type iron transport system FetAB ATPase subunit
VAHSLTIEDVSVHTLSSIRLDVKAGQCAGLTGPSGSGKTLLLRALADMDPHAGRVRLDGTAAEEMAPEQWRRRVGLLPAESAWWHDTVGPHFETDPRQWLEMLGFDGDVLAWDIRRLSSGERQRLALVRMLELTPLALLLDEPTANLDGRNIARVEAVIGAYRQRHRPAIVWVSHDLDQLRRNCERLYAIQGPRIQNIDSHPTPSDGGP